MSRSRSLLIASFFSIIFIVSLAFSASLWTTDIYGNPQTDFAPEQTVYIHGSGFEPNKKMSINVTRPDLVIDVCPFEWRCGELPFTDAIGAFIYPYVLDGIEGTYTIAASDGTNTAWQTFTDAANFHIKITYPIGGTATNPVRVSGTWNVTNNPPGHLYQYNVQIQWGDGYTTSAVNINRTEQGSGGNQIFRGNFDTQPIQGCNASDGEDNCNAGTFDHNYNISSVGCGPFNIMVKLYHQSPPGNEAGDAQANITINISEICDNGINDDCDTLIDCADPDCSTFPSCIQVCGNGKVETGEDCDPGGNYTDDCCTNNCKFEPSSYTCRPSAGICDVAEQCTGSSASCPADSKRPNSHVCRPSSGICDLDEYCDGQNNTCPSDAFRPNTYLCRASAGECDLEEYCTGSSSSCPANTFKPSSTPCEADSLFCTVDHCDGNGNCVYLRDYDCSDSNECTDDICNDSLDRCENPAKADGTSCNGDPGKCCSGICDNDGTSGSGFHSECRTGPSCIAPGNWGYTAANEGGDCGNSYGHACLDAASCNGHYYYDTCSSGYCSGTPHKIDDDTQCDGQDCGTCCICSSGSRSYDETQDTDCPATICPDGCWLDENPFTWDYANDEPNYCSALDTCSANECKYEHECHDKDPFDGIDGNTCGAECDQDTDCAQSTSMCDYINEMYCTRDSYGTCSGECACSYDEWTCSSENYCENCNHCGDGIVNCGEECEDSQKGNRCLPEGTSIVSVLNGVCYMYPEFNICNESTCRWKGCKKEIVSPSDPRYANCTIKVTPPTCGSGTFSCASGCCTTTTLQSAGFTYTLPKFNFPNYGYTMTPTTGSTTTTTIKYTTPTFTFPIFSFPTFTLPSFSWK